MATGTCDTLNGAASALQSGDSVNSMGSDIVERCSAMLNMGVEWLNKLGANRTVPPHPSELHYQLYRGCHALSVVLQKVERRSMTEASETEDGNAVTVSDTIVRPLPLRTLPHGELQHIHTAHTASWLMVMLYVQRCLDEQVMVEQARQLGVQILLVATALANAPPTRKRRRSPNEANDCAPPAKRRMLARDGPTVPYVWRVLFSDDIVRSPLWLAKRSRTHLFPVQFMINRQASPEQPALNPCPFGTCPHCAWKHMPPSLYSVRATCTRFCVRRVPVLIAAALSAERWCHQQ